LGHSFFPWPPSLSKAVDEGKRAKARARKNQLANLKVLAKGLNLPTVPVIFIGRPVWFMEEPKCMGKLERAAGNKQNGVCGLFR